jgi:hypothetical protein
MIKEEWAQNKALADIPLELIDCPDRRIPNAALDYAIRATVSPDVELTLLLPRRSYSAFLGRLLHDQTAEEIARPISQLPRVVATIIPFDVEKIISGEKVELHSEHSRIATVAPEIIFPAKSPSDNEPILAGADERISHYAESIYPIDKAVWRKRAHVRGRISSIRTAPSGGAPKVEVEVWDATGGITLQFLGRREIVGLEVGSTICAEGMVGEQNGALTILNPSYEIVI